MTYDGQGERANGTHEFGVHVGPFLDHLDAQCFELGLDRINQDVLVLQTPRLAVSLSNSTYLSDA